MGDNSKNLQAVPESTVEAATLGIRIQLQRQLSGLVKGMDGWQKMNSCGQNRVISQISDITGEFVTKLVEQLATDGRKVVNVKVDSVKIKDNVVVTLTAAKTPENVQDLGLAAGLTGFFVPFAVGEHMAQERDDADPDQDELPLGQAMVNAVEADTPIKDRIRITENGAICLTVEGIATPLAEVNEDDEDLVGEVAVAFGLVANADLATITAAISAQVADGTFVPFDKRPAEEMPADDPEGYKQTIRDEVLVRDGLVSWLKDGEVKELEDLEPEDLQTLAEAFDLAEDADADEIQTEVMRQKEAGTWVEKAADASA